jgi:DNA-binding phage protein
MAKKTTTYQEDLIEALKDPREAAAYLNAAMEEGDRALFLLALRNVAEAHGGMAAVSEKAKLNRESMRPSRVRLDSVVIHAIVVKVPTCLC